MLVCLERVLPLIQAATFVALISGVCVSGNNVPTKTEPGGVCAGAFLACKSLGPLVSLGFFPQGRINLRGDVLRHHQL